MQSVIQLQNSTRGAIDGIGGSSSSCSPSTPPSRQSDVGARVDLVEPEFQTADGRDMDDAGVAD